MSQQQQQPQENKPSGYININAEVNAFQRFICCVHNVGNTAADTPRSTSKRPAFAPPPIEEEVADEVEINITQ